MKMKKKKSKLGSGTVITNQSGETLGCPNRCKYTYVEVEFVISGNGSLYLDCNDGSDYEEAFEDVYDSDLAEKVEWDDATDSKEIVSSPCCGECGEALQIVKNNSIRLIQELDEEEDEEKQKE